MEFAVLALIKMGLLVAASMTMLVFLVQCAAYVGFIVTPLRGADRGRVQFGLLFASLLFSYVSTLL